MPRKGDLEKSVALMFRGSRLTGEALKEAIRDYLNNRAEPKGMISLSSLEKGGTKLENIQITEQNIGNFLGVARHYGVDYALKRDIATSPPTYYVFFKANSAADMKRAFLEYAAKEQKKENYIQREKLFNRQRNDIAKESPQREPELNLEPEDIAK